MNKMEITDQRTSFYSSNNGSRNRYLKFDDERFGNRNILGNNNNSSAQSILEEQNDQYMIDLEAKVQDLKYISNTMRQQVKESNDLLSSLSEEMGSFGVLLKGTINKIKTIGGTSSWKHIWIMTFFIFVVFLLMYILFKRN
ncbi:transmembrane [Cryptosporidium sp. chipmunk genotype I]|uniref:transmembrane n=1 Tax=Cryptosporidium sp. chipmunk genotype I TaxID=1280935 RepID=UPI00351A874B|nr:transmembrane [Cryptosporidium sp. chipmunk genotype I]